MGIGFSKPAEQQVAGTLSVGDRAPSLPGVQSSAKKFVAFLRHSGCPFAEATIKSMRHFSSKYPDIEFVAVTHGDDEITRNWLDNIGGTAGITHIHDDTRVLHGRWGIGFSDRKHFTGLDTLASVFLLLFKGIRNREDTGTRWQRSATFYVDVNSTVIWAHEAEKAHDLPDIGQAIANH